MAMDFEPIYSFEELCDICRSADFTEARKSGLHMDRYRTGFCADLVGRELPCRFDDGIRLTFRFPDLHTLEWCENGGAWHEEYYEALLSTGGNVIGVHFFRRHVLPFEGAFVVFDMDTGFVTWVSIQIGAAFDEKFARSFPHFGEIEGFGTHEGERHHFSNDLVGTSIDWEYNENFSIRHSYVSPTLTISPHLPEKNYDENDESFVGRRFLPAFNAKIRDKLLLTSFTEPGNCSAVLLIDLKSVHDIGCFFGLTHGGTLSSETITAHGGIGGDGLKIDEGYAHPTSAE